MQDHLADLVPEETFTLSLLIFVGVIQHLD